MKKAVLFFILLITTITTLPVFAQRIYTVGILPFETYGSGVTAADAAEATRLVTTEMSSWGIMTILPGGQANDGEYIVRGQVSRQNNQIVISATTTEARSGKALNTSKEQAATLREISIVTLCAQIAENIPFPNYLLGKWQSTINMIDGPVICILEFRSDRTVQVDRFDTWEHSAPDSLRYQAIGNGTYTYAGYLRRTVNIAGRQVATDATVGINLSLEDALPKYVDLSVGGLRVLFDDSKTSFELSYGGIPCGDNHSGPQVYPAENVYYTKFIKIR